MNRFLIFGTLLLTGLAACSDNTYKGNEPPAVVENTDPMQVLLSVGNPNYNILTKGSGAIDGTENDVWNDAKVYIYSFLKGSETDFSIKSTGDSSICLIDGSKDGNTLHGKLAIVPAGENFIKWDSDKPVYYPSLSGPFDFYGYYIDDLVITEANISRTADAIQLKNIKIDGTQDLMTAYAMIPEEDKPALEARLKEEYEVTLANAYNSFTARRDVQPKMLFKHHLARLKFEIYPGGEKSDSVYVKSISIETPTQATFTVVDKDKAKIGLDFTGSPLEILYLKDAKGAPLGQDYHVNYLPEYKDIKVYDRTPVRVGESMLVAPAESYNFRMDMIQKFSDKDPRTDYTTKLLTIDKSRFEAGKQYTVRIAIYGIQEIKIEVEVAPWLPGGPVDVDPDQPYKP